MSTLTGVIYALVEALERGDKLSYTGHLVVTDPDSEASVQMVLDEDDFAVLKGASRSATVALTVEEARGVRVAAMLGGPPPDDPHAALTLAINKLGQAENHALALNQER